MPGCHTVFARKRGAAPSFLDPQGHEGAPVWPLGRTTQGVGLGALNARFGLRRFAWRLGRTAAAVLALRCGAAGAAAYAPGEPATDAPSSAQVGADAVEPLQAASAGNGIQWTLAPWRYSGSVSLDARWLRLEDGTRSTLGLVFNDVEFATHVWQPWFIQLRAGLGTLAARDTTRGPGAPEASNTSTALTGRFSLAAFPLSRFPFELRTELSDSRVRGDSLGTDYRTERISLNQAYRPETGSDSYRINLERSRLRAIDGAADTVDSVRGTALREFADHSFELSGWLSSNERTDTDERSRIATLAARHSFHPASALHVDTMATWNDVQLRSSDATSRFDSASDIRQLSSFATWRPRDGEWLYSPSAPLYLTGSVRIVDATVENAAAQQHVRTLNGALGASQDLTREWRLAVSASGTQADQDGAPTLHGATGNASATYTPEGLSLGAWRYTPSMSGTYGVARSSDVGARRTLGVQLAHAVSRGLALREADSVSLNLTQSLGALHDSQSQLWSRAIAHSAGIYWQGSGAGASQSYAGLSISDSRTWAEERGSFQLVNLQLNRRTQWSRYASGSGNLTWQATRSDTTQIDAFTGTQRDAAPSWQSFTSGSLNYEQQRLLDVPRLRFTALLAANSQQLERRALGDVDAPRERITASLENRLDYAIGLLEARLSARLVRFDARSVASLFARVQRRY